MTPFVKWVGGKRKIANKIISKVNRKDYIEPFIGGGSIVFSLIEQGKIDHATISDKCDDLIDAYVNIKHNINDVIDGLNELVDQTSKEQYLENRSRFNNTTDPTERTVLFLYLNATSFNGLYRVNKSGAFNVPFGNRKNPTILRERNLRECSEALQKVDIVRGDFIETTKLATKDHFVYLDPPYFPLSKTSKFTSYTSDGFTKKDHARLYIEFDRLNDIGCGLALSNSDNPFVIQMYSDYKIEYTDGVRTIGGPSDYKQKFTEIIVSNGK